MPTIQEDLDLLGVQLLIADDGEEPKAALQRIRVALAAPSAPAKELLWIGFDCGVQASVGQFRTIRVSKGCFAWEPPLNPFEGAR